MKKQMKAVLGAVTTTAIAMTMFAGVILTQAEGTQGVLGNTALRPISAISFTGTSTVENSFDPSVLVLDSVTVYNTDVAIPGNNNAVVFITNGIGYLNWPAATVSYVDGQPDTSTLAAYQYAIDDAGQPTQTVSSTGEIDSVSYDEKGRIVSYSDGTTTEAFTYDANGVVQEVYANTTVTYDADGRISSTVQSDTGVLTYYYFDTLGYLRETASYTVSTGLETMVVYDYGDAGSQLGDFALQYPDVTSAAATTTTTPDTTTTTDPTMTTTTQDTTAAATTTQDATTTDTTVPNQVDWSAIGMTEGSAPPVSNPEDVLTEEELHQPMSVE